MVKIKNKWYKLKDSIYKNIREKTSTNKVYLLMCKLLFFALASAIT